MQFDAEAADFEASLAEPWNRLKYELELENLLEQLPTAPGESLRVLDAGGGTGELGLRLAERGHGLTLLDPSAAMLAIARDKAARWGLAGHCRFLRATVEALPDALGGERFDVILCHNVVEYVDDPAAVVRGLGATLRPGGLLSLVAMNSYALPLRSLLQHGEPVEALAAFGRHGFTNRFGIAARTFEPAALVGLVRDADLALVAWYGLRMFYDYTTDPRKTEPQYYETVKRLEIAARASDPYRQIGRDTHLLARATSAADGVDGPPRIEWARGVTAG